MAVKKAGGRPTGRMQLSARTVAKVRSIRVASRVFLVNNQLQQTLPQLQSALTIVFVKDMARPSTAATRNLTLTEELERLEQSITLTLQGTHSRFAERRICMG
jgi:hypothetical protein